MQPAVKTHILLFVLFTSSSLLKPSRIVSRPLTSAMATPGSSPSSNIDPCWHIDENAGIYSALSSQAYDDAQDESPQTPTASQTSQWSQGHNLPPRGKGTGAWNTPVSYTENSAQTFGFDVKKAAQRNKRLGQEMKRTTVGPMPVKVFLDTFFDTSSISFDSMPSPTNAFINVPAEPDKESDIYVPLIIALNAEGDRGPRCPGFTFRDTSNNADNSGGKVGAKKPDVCCYADHHLSLVETRSDNVNSLASRTDMGLAATYFEIKAKPSADVFSDPPNHADLDRATWQFVFKDLLKDALDEALEILGQHTAYASEIAMRQYRWCVYSIAMAGTIVRLMRWDRAGVIVTEAFDIHNHPEFLCRFLWCFAHASDTERGYDLTSTPAWPGDEPDFVARIKDHIKQQLPDVTSIKEKRKALGEHYAPDSVTSIFVLRSVQGIAVPYEYLVSRPMVAPLSMIGRGTRGYWAVDASTREVVFLKDTWRSGTREGTIMEELREGGVPIPPVEYHGDVPIGSITRESDGKVLHLNYGRSQTTMTQRFLGEAWVCGKNAEGGLQLDAVVRRTRYRLVSKFAGYPLTRIRGTAELLKGVYDAFQALRSAYERCKRLHRDVSPANIVLYHDGAQKSHECRQGYLIDWELSCDTSNSKQPPSASMSWQFRSIAAIVGMRTHCAAYKVQDDMESLYHVLVYCALLYLPHDLSPQRLLNRIQEYFDSSHVEGDEVKGGRGKLTDIQYGTLSDQVAWRSAEVSAWLCSVRPHLRDYGF
ncbi:hypothetical protein BC628DRAFT_547781 [Trametes gibbosa]|nr:hypothetical protein BC628DRAFT_547781 [Trametes gibbosa]